MSFSTLTPLTLDEFARHIATALVHCGTPRATCAHHTWSPTAASWRGASSMRAIRNYHISERGYSDIAANFYVGPDGLIWTARPMDRTNWAHAYVSRSWSSVHESARRFANGNRQALNRYAVGVEIVGRFDSGGEDPKTSRAMALALDAFAVMHEHWAIPLANLVFFHRFVANKSCPGNLVSHEWFVGEVASRMGQPAPSEVRVLMPNGDEVDCAARLENGRTVLQVAPLFDELHMPYRWEPPNTLHVGG